MSKQLIVRKERVVNAKPDEIWNVITTPDLFDKWMFVPGQVFGEKQFGLGSKIEWINEKGIVYLTGEVIEFVPNNKIVISMQDISWEKEVPKGTVTYEFHITETGKGTQVKFYLGDLSIDPEGKVWFDAYSSSDEIGAIEQLIKKLQKEKATTR